MSAFEPVVDIEELRRRLEEAEETLRAIRCGEVDALVVCGQDGERIYTLQGADHPYRALIESMQQGAATLSVDGIILYCNQRFAEMVARPQERVIGAAVAEFVPASHRVSFRSLLNRQDGRGEFLFEAPEGGLLPIYVSLSMLPLNGETSICMVVTDLTEQKQHQGLQEANRRKDEFLAMLAHELRNPLAPIRNALYLLKRGEMDRSSSAEVRSMMERQVDHLARLIDDLMDVSRISSGKVELRMQVVDLRTVVDRAIEISRPLIEQKGHELVVDIPDELIRLDADPTRVEQILDNLLTNAAKYSDPGGHITLSVSREGDSALVRLRDDGIGIAPEKLPHIFDLFVQAERRLDRSQGGLGLGLSLVKSLVELHGGNVTALSAGLGKGTEFIVRLPVRPASENHETVLNGHAIPSASVLPRFRILVVDDNVDSARSMRMVLRRLWDQDAEVAHDGIEALEKAQQFRPEVILLDIGLPGMSGYEVAERLRSHPRFRHILLVAMTGLGQEDDLRQSHESGFDYHLVKPVDLSVLRELLSNIADLPTGTDRAEPIQLDQESPSQGRMTFSSPNALDVNPLDT
jgi:PAS domain S-box-containing protein